MKTNWFYKYHIRELISIMLMFFPFAVVSAKTPWRIDTHTNVSWNVTEGVIYMDVMYFDDHGSDVVDYNSAVDPMYISFGDTEIKIDCNDEGGSLSVNKTRGTADYFRNGEYWKGNDHWLSIGWRVKQSELNSEQTIAYNGKWWHRGATGDDKISGSRTITPSWSRDPFNVVSIVPISDYTVYNNKPAIKINWNRSSTGNMNGSGKVTLCDRNGNALSGDLGVVSNTPTASGIFYLNVSGDNSVNLSVVNTYVIKQTYTPTKNSSLKYETTSDAITLPAYPQVSTFTAEFNASTKNIVLKWTLSNAPATDYIDDNFVISYTSNGKAQPDITVPYQGGVNNYSYNLAVDEGVDAIYSFKIRHESTMSNSYWDVFTKSVSNLSINTIHAKAVDAKVDLSDDQKSAVITWNYSGLTWSSGSKLSIIRQNETNGTSDEIYLITKWDEFAGNKGNERKYVDNTIRLCNQYRYKLQVIPNENYASLTPVYTESIEPVTIGSVLNFKASKGYFSDRVELSWEINGGFDNFVIERKEADAPESAYKQIIMEPGSLASMYYNKADETCEAGKVYSYRVKGLLNCNNTIKESLNKLEDIGFRTPTGDIYGRVTFENNQAESGVEVFLETKDEIPGKSLVLNTGKAASILNPDLLSTNTQASTLQLWFAPSVETGSHQRLISKAGMYELGINADGNLYLDVNGSQVISKQKIADLKRKSTFIHLTGVFSGDSMALYINGLRDSSVLFTGSVNGNRNVVEFGSGYKGAIDEVRIWGRALPADEILRDYTRYLVGNESDLLAYYTFNYGAANNFYDTSYKGSEYHANHGVFDVADVETSGTQIPTAGQLGYRGVTTEDGAYAIRGVPYVGNGSAFTIIPKYGIHTFKPAKEDRFIGATASSHTVNFTDMSTFRVTGKVIYRGGNFPVEGANFRIDGVIAMNSNGTPFLTNANGEFDIKVPVGTHEVKVEMNNHDFVDGGRICDQFKQDLNYQDDIRELVLQDTTTIRFIGRVAGGAIQENYPLGHSLSKNNLSDKMYVRLSHLKQDTYKLTVAADSLVEMDHFIPSNMKAADQKHNSVHYTPNYIEVIPNPETGEFMADILPLQYTVEVNVSGHDDMPGTATLLNATKSFAKLTSVHNYQDSVKINDETYLKDFSDTIRYQLAQKYIKRYTPQLRIRQLNAQGLPVNYFGKDSIVVTNAFKESTKVPLYDAVNGKYVFDRPVFQQNETYEYQADMFEAYRYYVSLSNSYTVQDEVPTADATLTFINKLAIKDQQSAVTVETDSLGMAIYSFQAGEPELTTATANLTATAVYGPSNNPTAINWTAPFTDGLGYLLGIHMTGTNFVTAGPDKILTVLRDPPGSNSYAYLEKGTSFETSSKYTGSIANEGTEDFTTGVKSATQQITTVGVGTQTGTASLLVETDSGITYGISHSEEYEGSDEKKSSVTTTTRFQTSDDPSFVGPMADLFIGCGVNITFGATQNVTLLSRSDYDAAVGEGFTFDQVYKQTPDWVMVQKKGINANTTFSTLFAYPQIHIETVLLPQLEEMRNKKLLLPGEATKEQLQALADADKTKVFYLSKVAADDEHFAQENYYEHIYNKELYAAVDTVEYLNESIKNWKKNLADNEKAKVKVTSDDLYQNYSFHAGSPIEYSEEYATGQAHESTFSISIGGKISNDMLLGAATVKTKFEFEENATTTHGGDFTSEAERSHAKGFVLSEDGSDYLSVDVYHEPGWNPDSEEYKHGGNGGTVGVNDITDKSHYSSFIFKTRGGVTSCPYEGENRTQYYEKDQHVLNQATVRLEVPYIDVEKNFIENVPSGETAKLVLFLRNNSETGDDMYYDLKVVDEANPDGARLSIDGGAIGNGRAFLVPGGNTLVKTLEVGKGRVLNYDNLKLILGSQCQNDPTGYWPVVNDTVSFSVHFVPSCSNITVKKPYNNWTYNTRLPKELVDGVEKHYLDVVLSDFDVNYDDFDRLALQYKSSSKSDNEWVTLKSYYNDSIKYKKAIKSGLTAAMIEASDAGKINYKLFMDDFQDQNYDLRAVTVCNINNVEIENYSPVVSGIKDMYNPRLFGAPEPANSILTVEDEIRLNFNEQLAQGLITKNNFQVTGVRNGSVTDHSTSVELDGTSSLMASEVRRNLLGKDVTFEGWVNPTDLQDATIFAHGDNNNSMELAITADKHLKVKVGDKVITSDQTIAFDKGTWSHVALVYHATGTVSAYYNFKEMISNAPVGSYTGIGNIVLGGDIEGQHHLAGKMHTVRIWDRALTEGELILNKLAQLSGSETGLIAYYPMKEGKGAVVEDKARGANLVMDNCKWALPAGYAAEFDGASYLTIPTDAAVTTSTMDYAMEFWFKTAGLAKDMTMISNGRGDGDEVGDSKNTFSVGFDQDGVLAYHTNANVHRVEGNYTDGQWHHFVMTVSRSNAFARIYMDGQLNSYFDADQIGGVAAAKAVVGARGWYAKEDTLKLRTDQYFKGKVDEFRLWSLNKTQSIVETADNERLNGDEMGLLAYYPFETYIVNQGIKLLNTSYKDHKVSEQPATVEKIATPVGNVQFTSDEAPVKDKGPVSNLAFEFVVNDDALIITLTEAPAKVEKTLVTFTAQDIFDMNGNQTLSPITWSAYINQNQLVWAEDQINIDKKVYEPYEFKVPITNKGGLVQNYTISNQPSWLTVTPTSGSVTSDASQDIDFSIAEGLNIGTYNEIVYLTNSNGVSEALDLTVTVSGEEPDWSVTTADYQYNMSVYGKMRFKNVYSADKRDKIAAFQKGRCIGVANCSYHSELDMWQTMLTVYNNQQTASDITFRMWDASTGVIYEAVPSEPITFRNDAVYGTPQMPVTFDGTEMVIRNIDLEKGWNWISYNVKSSDLSDVNTLLANGNWTNHDIVKTMNRFDSYSTSTGKWSGTLSKNGGFDNLQMYWLKSANPQMISITGVAVEPENTPLTIAAQSWTPISYLPMTNLTVKTALAGYDAAEGDVVKSKDGFAMFYRNNWIGSLSYMEANKGYMLRNTSSQVKTLTYPSAAATMVGASKVATRRTPASDLYAGNMSIIAVCEELQPEDQLYAVVNGERRGINSTVDLSGMKRQFITIAGDAVNENDPIRFVLSKADGEELTSTTVMPYRANGLQGSMDAPVAITFNQRGSVTEVYPVPFNDLLYIHTFVSEKATIQVEITDLTGAVVYRSPIETIEANKPYAHTVNAKAFVDGVYLISIYENGVPIVRKALKGNN